MKRIPPLSHELSPSEVTGPLDIRVVPAHLDTADSGGILPTDSRQHVVGASETSQDVEIAPVGRVIFASFLLRTRPALRTGWARFLRPAIFAHDHARMVHRKQRPVARTDNKRPVSYRNRSDKCSKGSKSSPRSAWLPSLQPVPLKRKSFTSIPSRSQPSRFTASTDTLAGRTRTFAPANPAPPDLARLTGGWPC